MKNQLRISSIFFLVICLIAINSIKIYAQEPLIANWRFNNSASDETGNYDLIPSSDFSYSVDGILEGTATGSFEGNTKYAKTGVISLGQEFTITGWFKSYNSDYNRGFITNDGDEYYYPNGFHIRVDGSELRFRTGDGTTRTDAYITISNLATNKWFFYAVVVNKNTSTCTLYINKFGEATSAMASANQSINSDFNTSDSLLLGKLANSSFYGYLDDVRIYNRQLTADEVGTVFEFGDIVDESTTYDLTTTVVGQGSLSPSSGTYDEGTSVSITR